MGRSLYLVLLRLHPRAFRDRFGAEMLDIFDEEARNGTPVRLLWDGFASLLRQRALRRTPGRAACHAAVPAPQPGAPAFHLIESRPPGASALAHGAILSLLYFGVITFSTLRGDGRFPRLLIGVKYPRPSVLGVVPSSVPGAALTTEVRAAPPVADPLQELANIYFKAIRPLEVLDADRDRVVSAREVSAAASVLSKLDRDGDGRLSSEECGLTPGDPGNPSPAAARTRRNFMKRNPVLAALDADGGGDVSSVEIGNSVSALRSMDRNRDGDLTPVEVLPVPVPIPAVWILSRLDRNLDFELSPEEQAAKEAEPLRGLLQRADRNRDGVVTERELAVVMRSAEQGQRLLEGAKRGFGLQERADR